MKTKVKHLHEKLLASYWFVPGLMSVLAMSAAVGALACDAAEPAPKPPRWHAWLEVNTADGARELLGTIAGSTITLAGVIFSITVLALSFASSHYGPRLLRNFMRDRPSQVVLGAFVSTFLYCLLVLRTIGPSGERDVPHLAVAGALLASLANMALLIFFVHHIARSLQVTSIIAAVGRDLDELARLHAEFAAGPGAAPPGVEDRGAVVRVVEARADGYVQALSNEDLTKAAKELGALIEMHVEPGDYVSPGFRVASVRACRRGPTEADLDAIRAGIVVGLQRTNEQDLAFPVDQLAEVAVRALSPGLNDPFTAVQCINRLGGGLAQLAKHRWPEPMVRDEEGAPRVLLLRTTFERLVRRAFDQVLHFGGANPVIPRQVMKALALAAEQARPEHRAVLAVYADEVLAGARTRGVAGPDTELADFHRRARGG